MKRKGIAILLVLVFMLTHLTGCFGCRCEPGKSPEEGYFTYRLVQTNSEDPTEGHVIITGLSELGKEQEVIYIPNTLLGYRVTEVGNTAGYFGGNNWQSAKLKRIYILHWDIRVVNGIFDDCVNLETIISIDENPRSNATVYLLYGQFNEYWGTYANTTFLLNYEEHKRLDCFWLENGNYGETINEPLIQPEREGYEFAGWYKEAECENEWDFETDILPQPKYDENENLIYQETILYAKWIKN